MLPLASSVRGVAQEAPWWAKRFPLHAEIAVHMAEHNDDPVWGIVAGYVEDYEYPVEKWCPWPHDSEITYHKETGRFISVRLYDGVEVLVPLENTAEWKPPVGKKNLFTLLLCALGIHDWEERVAKRGLVRTTNWFGGWLIMQDQDGLQCCRRSGCKAMRKVARSGGCGGNKEDKKWKPAR